MGFPTKDHVGAFCKPGRGSDTCRYLMAGADGWECGKVKPNTKMTIDRMVSRMTAKGDNCPGV